VRKKFDDRVGGREIGDAVDAAVPLGEVDGIKKKTRLRKGKNSPWPRLGGGPKPSGEGKRKKRRLTNGLAVGR